MDPTYAPLQGRFVRLEPFAKTVKTELQAALDGDSEAWSLLSRTGSGPHFNAWWADTIKLAAARTAQPMVIRRMADGRVIGTSSFLNLRPHDRVGEIGATFLHMDARGGAANPESKRLMLAHAFDGGLFGAPANRIEIVTDLRNLRSQAAISKLGAHREGILRKHKVTWTGHVRDTVMFSIIAEEWPVIRDGLDTRLERFA